MHFAQRSIARAASLALAAIALNGALAPVAQAQGGPGAAQPARQSYRIAPGALAPALRGLASSANLLLSFTEEQTAGKTTAGVSGEHTPEAALALLLQGSGLRAVALDGGGYVLRSASQPGDAAPAPADGHTLAPVTVSAQAARPGDLPDVYAGGQVAAGGRVGLLGNLDFMETPFNAISYTGDYIDNQQAQELSRVIATTDPSVFNNGTTGMIMDSFALRGFSVSSSDVAFGGLYGVIPYWRITPELAERVEVLKGPTALLNGMPPGGSVGGSINLVPKRAGDTPLTRVTVNYASDSQFGTHVDLGRRFGDERQFGIRFNGVWRDGDGAVKDQSKKAKLAGLGLDWRTRRVRLSADLYHNLDRVDGLNRGVSLAPRLAVPRPPSPDTVLAPDWTFSNTKDQALVLRGEVDLTQDVTAYAAYGRSKTDFDSLASSTYTVFNAAGDFRNNFSHQRIGMDKDTAEFGVRARLNTAGVKHQLALSGTYYHHDYRFGFRRNMLASDWVTNIYHPVWGPAIGRGFSHEALPKTAEVRTSSIGIADTLSFAQDRIQLTLGVRRQSVVSDTIDGVSGLRTARYDASAVTPAAALLVKASERVSLYANTIEGLSQGSTAPVTAANAGEVFPPFKTKQQEIGAKLDLGSFAATLALFQIKRPSALTDPVTNLYSFGGEQRNRGVELGFFGEPWRGLRLMGGLAYTQAKLTRTAGGLNQGRLATAMPKWQGKLGVEWDVPALKGLTLTGNAVLASRQYINADNSLWVPGRGVVDLGARYATAIAGRPLTLRATVQNVANRAYWASTLTSGLGAPRTVLLSATVDF